MARQIKNLIAVSLTAILLSACNSKSEDLNPPDEGFDVEHSDPAAVELADSIMISMGGRSHWEKTRYFSWSFSGIRDIVWDKQENRVRVTILADTAIFLLSPDTNEGRVQLKGKEVADPVIRAGLVNDALNRWTQDLRWLFIPFKLKSRNVVLKYLGEDRSLKGETCNILQVTMGQPTDVPLDKYLLYVDRADNLVKQWAYFSLASKDSADFIRPWDNYAKYEGVLLSSDRSDGEGPRTVKVNDNLPDEIFTEF